MNLPQPKDSVSAAKKVNPPRRGRPTPQRPGMTKFSGACENKEARKTAAAILEVLAGVATPTEAAEALDISVPRYYALEGRALEGLLKACEPRPKGPRQSPQREIAQLNAEIERLEREGARTQALLRASQRTVGLPSLERRGTKSKTDTRAKKGKKRRPVARALRAAKLLRLDESKNSVETSVEGEQNDAVKAK